VAALIVATVPIWMVLLDSLGARRAPPGRTVVGGLCLGLLAIATLIGPGRLGGAPVHMQGAIVILFAAFSWALGSVYWKRAPQSAPTLQNVGMQMLLGGAILLVGGIVLGERIAWSSISARSAWALAYLSIFGSVVSYSAYVWLLRVAAPAKVATYAYVNPVVAVLLGWTLGGETLSARVLVASIAVVSAVAMMIGADNNVRTPEPRKSTGQIARKLLRMPARAGTKEPCPIDRMEP